MKHLELTVEELAIKLAQAMIDKNNIPCSGTRIATRKRTT